MSALVLEEGTYGVCALCEFDIDLGKCDIAVDVVNERIVHAHCWAMKRTKEAEVLFKQVNVNGLKMQDAKRWMEANETKARALVTAGGADCKLSCSGPASRKMDGYKIEWDTEPDHLALSDMKWSSEEKAWALSFKCMYLLIHDSIGPKIAQQAIRNVCKGIVVKCVFGQLPYSCEVSMSSFGKGQTRLFFLFEPDGCQNLFEYASHYKLPQMHNTTLFGSRRSDVYELVGNALKKDLAELKFENGKIVAQSVGLVHCISYNDQILSVMERARPKPFIRSNLKI